MGQVPHQDATTKATLGGAIQHIIKALVRCRGINSKRVFKWKKLESTAGLRTGHTVPETTVLSAEQEALVVAFRKRTPGAVDDCLYALQAAIPQLTTAWPRFI